MFHVGLKGSLQGVGQEFGEAVEELRNAEGPVQNEGLGLALRVHRSQDLENTLWENKQTNKANNNNKQQNNDPE